MKTLIGDFLFDTKIALYRKVGLIAKDDKAVYVRNSGTSLHNGGLYYNKELKRWVTRGEEQQVLAAMEKASAPPPSLPATPDTGGNSQHPPPTDGAPVGAGVTPSACTRFSVETGSKYFKAVPNQRASGAHRPKLDQNMLRLLALRQIQAMAETEQSPEHAEERTVPNTEIMTTSSNGQNRIQDAGKPGTQWEEAVEGKEPRLDFTRQADDWKTGRTNISRITERDNIEDRETEHLSDTAGQTTDHGAKKELDILDAFSPSPSVPSLPFSPLLDHVLQSEQQSIKAAFESPAHSSHLVAEDRISPGNDGAHDDSRFNQRGPPVDVKTSPWPTEMHNTFLADHVAEDDATSITQTVVSRGGLRRRHVRLRFTEARKIKEAQRAERQLRAESHSSSNRQRDEASTQINSTPTRSKAVARISLATSPDQYSRSRLSLEGQRNVPTSIDKPHNMVPEVLHAPRDGTCLAAQEAEVLPQLRSKVCDSPPESPHRWGNVLKPSEEKDRDGGGSSVYSPSYQPHAVPDGDMQSISETSSSSDLHSPYQFLAQDGPSSPTSDRWRIHDDSCGSSVRSMSEFEDYDNISNDDENDVATVPRFPSSDLSPRFSPRLSCRHPPTFCGIEEAWQSVGYTPFSNSSSSVNEETHAFSETDQAIPLVGQTWSSSIPPSRDGRTSSKEFQKRHTKAKLRAEVRELRCKLRTAENMRRAETERCNFLSWICRPTSMYTTGAPTMSLVPIGPTQSAPMRPSQLQVQNRRLETSVELQGTTTEQPAANETETRLEELKRDNRFLREAIVEQKRLVKAVVNKAKQKGFKKEDIQELLCI